MAKLAPVLGTTYAAWIADTRLVALLPVWQIFRGALFVSIAAPILSLFPRRKRAAIALCASLSVLMPLALRLVHFFELTCSMILYSLCLIALLTKPKPAQG